MQQKTEREAGAKLRIRNVSGALYHLEELGVDLAVDEVVDLLDEALPEHYLSWQEANDLVAKANASKLWIDLQSGDLEVVENVPPQEPTFA